MLQCRAKRQVRRQRAIRGHDESGAMSTVVIAEHRQDPVMRRLLLLYEVPRVAEKGQVVPPQTKCLLKDSFHRCVVARPVKAIWVEEGKPASHRVTGRQNETATLAVVQSKVHGLYLQQFLSAVDERDSVGHEAIEGQHQPAGSLVRVDKRRPGSS